MADPSLALHQCRAASEHEKIDAHHERKTDRRLMTSQGDKPIREVFRLSDPLPPPSKIEVCRWRTQLPDIPPWVQEWAPTKHFSCIQLMLAYGCLRRTPHRAGYLGSCHYSPQPTAPPTTSGCPPFSTASQHIRMHAQRDCSSFDRDATLGDATGFFPTGSVYLRTPARCLAVSSRECFSCWLVLRPPLVDSATNPITGEYPTAGVSCREVAVESIRSGTSKGRVFRRAPVGEAVRPSQTVEDVSQQNYNCFVDFMRKPCSVESWTWIQIVGYSLGTTTARYLPSENIPTIQSIQNYLGERTPEVRPGLQEYEFRQMKVFRFGVRFSSVRFSFEPIFEPRTKDKAGSIAVEQDLRREIQESDVEECQRRLDEEGKEDEWACSKLSWVKASVGLDTFMG
ncbi:hypothetical protein B0H16DRAFT_1463658 [Mycena metata]|uniref:Uncharacterized protein n=1 Tax=Mycena metata TaxID=1033252 RepID=A0AAD7N2Y5_9AGAR|nr:hypothetical protein B0H16DRAFT_1463658 [Mycena metata]